MDRLVVYQSLAGRGRTRYLPLANAMLGGDERRSPGRASATREEPLR